MTEENSTINDRNPGLITDLISVLSGNKKVHEVREKLRYSPRGFYHTVYLLDMLECLRNGSELDEGEISELRSGLGKHRNSEIDALIDMGLTLGEMKSLHGMDRQYYEQYIKGSGQNGYWFKKKEERKQADRNHSELISKVRSDLLGKINTHVISPKMVLSENPSVEERVEFYVAKNRLDNDHKGRHADLQKLRILLREYFNSLDKGEHPSLDDLAKRAGYTQGVGANYFLSNFGLKSLNGTHVKINPRDVPLIKRAKNTTFSTQDIKYFTRTNASPSKVANIVRGGREHKSRTITFSKGGDFGTRHVSYTDASQVYQAQDLGFDRNELEVLFPKLDGDLLEGIVANRGRISKVIIKGLRKIYADKSINTPYLP